MALYECAGSIQSRWSRYLLSREWCCAFVLNTVINPYPVCEILFCFCNFLTWIPKPLSHSQGLCFTLNLTKTPSLLLIPQVHSALCVCVHARIYTHVSCGACPPSFLSLTLHVLSPVTLSPISSRLIPFFPPCWNGSSVPDRNANENRYFGFSTAFLLACACRGVRCFAWAGENRGWVRCSLLKLTYCRLFGQSAKSAQFSYMMSAISVQLACATF